jgi:hypothetical protein
MVKFQKFFGILKRFAKVHIKKWEDYGMRKFGTALLALALILSLTACGGGGESASTSGTSDESSSNSQDTASTTNNETEEKLQLTFDETTIIDNDECTVKITEIDPDNLWGYTLKANLENKSAEKNYMFSVESAAINGVQCDPVFATEVAAGKKANSDISFSSSSLEEYGIQEYTDIELTFRVYDSDDWLADNVAKETVHIYPYGTDKATTYVREAQSTDIVLVDNDYVTAVVTGFDPDNLWGYTVNLYLENKTDTTVMFSVDNASVNGYMADPFYATSVAPQKCAFSSISWSSSDFEQNGISEVNEIEMLFKAYDSDNWQSDSYFEDVITLNPQIQ